MKNNTEVYRRHRPLIKLYRQEPQEALITDIAEVKGKNLTDPFRTEVIINEELEVPFTVGVHWAVGGDHDHPNPGDILCASLAVCFESTLRMVANRLQIKLTKTSIKVRAQVDVRGTLMMDPTVPVGFQSMVLEGEVEGSSPRNGLLNTLIETAKHCCIVYQTLQKGIPIHVEIRGIEG